MKSVHIFLHTSRSYIEEIITAWNDRLWIFPFSGAETVPSIVVLDEIFDDAILNKKKPSQIKKKYFKTYDFFSLIKVSWYFIYDLKIFQSYSLYTLQLPMQTFSFLKSHIHQCSLSLIILNSNFEMNKNLSDSSKAVFISSKSL